MTEEPATPQIPVVPYQGPNPFDNPDVQAIVAEVPKSEIDELERSDAVRQFLAQPEVQDSGVYVFGTLKLRHRKFMTHRLRSIISKAPKAANVSDDPMETTQTAIYDALAEIFMDDPYNRSVFWKLADERSRDGRVHKIFTDLIEKIGAGEKNVKSFR